MHTWPFYSMKNSAAGLYKSDPLTILVCSSLIGLHVTYELWS